MIEVNNLTFGYKNFRPVFIDLNLKFDEGGIYGLLGRNGLGKSTLLYLISGMLTPLKGNVEFDGIDPRLRMPSTLSDIFIVPEEFTLPAVSMEEYCKINAPFYPNFSIDDLRTNMLNFNLNPADNLAYMSMGQKKKAFICFALACNTRLLMMDEPTNGLDITGKADFRRFIAANMNPKRTVIISTHQVHDVELLLDHILILGENGYPVVNSTTDNITHRLRFYVSPSDMPDPDSIFSRSSFGTTMNIAVRKESDDETELNLEMLFEMASANPALLHGIMTSPDTPTL